MSSDQNKVSTQIRIATTRKPAIQLPVYIKVDPADLPLYKSLIDAAKEACQNAYQPYSLYSVGAAVLTFDGKIHSGFNIENCGYSQTIHAEEAAVTAALTGGVLKRAEAAGLSQFEAILAVAVHTAKGSDPWPCCNCRQFMGEFGYDMHIIGEDPKSGQILCLTLGQLVPFAFPIKDVLANLNFARAEQVKQK